MKKSEFRGKREGMKKMTKDEWSQLKEVWRGFLESREEFARARKIFSELIRSSGGSANE